MKARPNLPDGQHGPKKAIAGTTGTLHNFHVHPFPLVFKILFVFLTYLPMFVIRVFLPPPPRPCDGAPSRVRSPCFLFFFVSDPRKVSSVRLNVCTITVYLMGNIGGRYLGTSLYIVSRRSVIMPQWRLQYSSMYIRWANGSFPLVRTYVQYAAHLGRLGSVAFVSAI